MTKLFALIVSAFLLAPVPAFAQAFVLYDDFSSGIIDPAKWYGSSVDGNFSGPMAEMSRRIEGGQLRLMMTNYGNTLSDSGTTTGRIDLRPKLTGVLGGPGFIVGMQANATILASRIQKCGANTSTGGARAQMLGFFFNDGTSTGPDDRTGNIIGFINMQKNAPPLDNQVITAGISRCLIASCEQSTTLASQTFDATWALNETVTLRLVWKKANGKFTFVAKGETHDIFYPGGLIDSGPPITSFNALRASNFVENCAVGYKKGVTDVVFDGFSVRRQP